MKKKIYLLSLVAMSVAFTGTLTSCSDDDIQLESPNDINQDNFYKTEADFQTAILGVYNDFRTNGLFGNTGFSNDMIILGDLMSDNLINNPFGRRGNYNASNWVYTGNSDVTSLYENGYRVVSDANKILSKINNLSDDVAAKKRFRAEALALRAIAHFEIAKSFAQIPTQASGAANSQGIAYITEFNFTAEPAREANIGIVYDKIIKDLEDALAIGAFPVNVNVTSSASYYRLTQTSVKGILAKVYLFKGNYPKVIEYATPVVDANLPTNKADLEEFWKSNVSSGALFAFPFSKTNDIAIGGNYSQGTSAGNFRAEYTVDKAFAESFNQTTEPERYKSSIMSITQANYDPAGPIYAVKKYFGSKGSAFNAGVRDGRYLRTEDVILMLAEAQYLSGNQSGALTTLNKLRDARYTAYTGGETGDALFEAIITERRKELAFEIGDRFFTLKRLLGVPGIPAKYAQGIQRSGNGHRADGSGNPSAVQTLAPGSFKWQLPVKQTTLNLDKNIGQTDGY
ncbi:RagB/SusD family nutrient uptake outer membrane protein [Empedobacter brevis]|uniref:RagB/SusD family nutrient uptake outer membrane protein n=1 Tax=Empedobacter brevis TaxID=247 RepID=UPI0028996CC6|nr:RagB/SusD family nutrient uptake outer membrane protein [Empedobacter brevis]